jgi:hypothetical protein
MLDSTVAQHCGMRPHERWTLCAIISSALIFMLKFSFSTDTATETDELSPALRNGGSNSVIAACASPAASSASVPDASAVVPAASASAVSASSYVSSAARLYTREGQQPLSALEIPASRLPVLTHEAQLAIWTNQHPTSCENAKYRIYTGHSGGIGSTMHVAASALARAMNEGRVFIFSADSALLWTDDSTCRGDRSWGCFFQPPSPCGLEFAADPVTIRAGFQRGEGPESGPTGETPPPPRQLLAKLAAAAPELSAAARNYWWCAQATAYLMRLNDATLAAVRALRQDALLLQLASAASPGSSEGGGAPLITAADALTIPLPPGMIHAHVRHGDKHTEMELQGTSVYTAAAIAVREQQPLLLRRILLVSTEDASVITEAQDILVKDGWSVIHYAIPRSNIGQPSQQIADLGPLRAANTTRTHLQQLLWAMEADAWISTRGSNWNRLIDELRCIWVDKCALPLVEVGTRASWLHWVGA